MKHSPPSQGTKRRTDEEQMRTTQTTEILFGAFGGLSSLIFTFSWYPHIYVIVNDLFLPYESIVN